MKRISFKYIVLVAIIILYSCDRSSKKKNFNEGYIEYSIDINETDKSKIGSFSLPSKLTVKFKENSTINRIEGMSGSVNLTFIKNVDDEMFLVLVNLWAKKLYYQDSLIKKCLPKTYPGMENLSIEKVDGMVKFNGFSCKKAIAHLNDTSNLSFEILYTNEINIANPNSNTPFEPIDGVMLKFSIKLNKYLMNLSASTIRQESISNEEFELPNGYEKVSKRTIEDLVSLMQ